MKVKVQRFMKDNTHHVYFCLLHGEPVPGMYSFMRDRKLADLARLWAILDGRFVDERTDANAALVARVEKWKDLTVADLKGFEVAADPVIVAALEEAVRRALQMLFVMDDYADRFAKREEDLELDSAATPTGQAAVPPTPKS